MGFRAMFRQEQKTVSHKTSLQQGEPSSEKMTGVLSLKK